MMKKISHNYILSLKCGFSMGYGIGRKYWSIWVSVSVLYLNQNCDFGRTLLSGDNDMSRHYPSASTTGKSYSSIERVLCTFLWRVVKSPTWFLIFGFMFLSLFIRLSSKYLVW